MLTVVYFRQYSSLPKECEFNFIVYTILESFFFKSYALMICKFFPRWNRSRWFLHLNLTYLGNLVWTILIPSSLMNLFNSLLMMSKYITLYYIFVNINIFVNQAETKLEKNFSVTLQLLMLHSCRVY